MAIDLRIPLVPTPPALIYWDVVSEHLDEAEFLLEQWEASLRSPLDRLDGRPARLEARLEAHIDGLAIGGPAAAERLLEPELEDALAPERATVAGLVFLASGRRDAWREVLEAVTYAETERQGRAVARAITLYEAPHFETVLIDAFQYARSPREKAALIEALAARRLDPGRGLAACLDATYVPLAAAAITAAGRAGRRDLVPAIEERLPSEVPELRGAAVEAALILGSGAAIGACRRDGGPEALLLLALTGTEGGFRAISRSLDDEETRGAALFALGFAGRTEGVERCLTWLESPDDRTAKLAAEAIGAVTGLDTSAREVGAVSGEDDELDGDISKETRASDPVDQLPMPNPRAIADWWEAHRGEFDPAQRYLYGRPNSPEALVGAVRSAPMRRRHALALELSIRTEGRAFVDTAAFTARQRRQLREVADLSELTRG